MPSAENDAPLTHVPFIKAPMPDRRDFPRDTAENDRTREALRVIQRTANKQGNVTMLRLAENIANDAALVRLSRAEGWDAAVQEAEDCGLLSDVFADEIRGRNPYRDEGSNR